MAIRPALRGLALAGLALGLLGTVLPAQEPTTDDLSRRPMGQRGRGGRMPDRRASPSPAAIPPQVEPAKYDVGISLSDRTVNRIVKVVVDANLKKAQAGSKKLEELLFTFDEDNSMTLAGTYVSPATANTRHGKFAFNLKARVAFPSPNDLSFEILSTRVMLDGMLAFESRPENPGAIAVLLDFFSPGIARGASKGLANVGTALARRMGTPPEETPLNELVSISGNKVSVHILPTILSPLFPPLNITWIKVAKGKLSFKGDFQ